METGFGTFLLPLARFARASYGLLMAFLWLFYGLLVAFFLGGQPPRPPVARFARAFVTNLSYSMVFFLWGTSPRSAVARSARASCGGASTLPLCGFLPAYPPSRFPGGRFRGPENFRVVLRHVTSRNFGCFWFC
jgi:hypothetical protein